MPGLGKVQPAKLTPMHVQRFVGAQLAAGVGPTAVQQALTTLRMALKQAVLWGMLPRNVVTLLLVHRERQAKERADAVEWHDLDLVLCTRTGRPIGQRNAHRSWTRILKQAGVAHRGMHHLRHTFVTALAERGVPERAAQHLAGHADSRMTRRIYNARHRRDARSGRRRHRGRHESPARRGHWLPGAR